MRPILDQPNGNNGIARVLTEYCAREGIEHRGDTGTAVYHFLAALRSLCISRNVNFDELVRQERADFEHDTSPRRAAQKPST